MAREDRYPGTIIGEWADEAMGNGFVVELDDEAEVVFVIESSIARDDGLAYFYPTQDQVREIIKVLGGRTP